MRFRPLIAGACSLILSNPAHAELSEAGKRWFDSFDQNKDSIITPEEYNAVAEKQFRRVDSNADGSIDFAEYSFGIPEDQSEEVERAKTRFLKMDSNGDGLATSKDYTDFGLAIIEICDGNGDQDGRMTIDEFAAQVAPSE